MLVPGSKDWYARVPKDLPILFVSGQEDPVSNYGAGIRAVSDRLKATGRTRVQVLYPVPGTRSCERPTARRCTGYRRLYYQSGLQAK